MIEYLVMFHISGGRTVNGVYKYPDFDTAVSATDDLLRGTGKFKVPGKHGGQRAYLVERSFVVYAEVMKYDGGKLPDEKNRK